MIFGWITSKVTVLATNFDGNFTTISDTGVTFVDLFQEEYNTKKEKEKKKGLYGSIKLGVVFFEKNNIYFNVGRTQRNFIIVNLGYNKRGSVLHSDNTIFDILGMSSHQKCCFVTVPSCKSCFPGSESRQS